MNLAFFKSKQSIQKEWKAKTLSHAQAVNAYIEKGIREGWDAAGEEPPENGCEALAKYAIRAVREANRAGTTDALRESWPPTHLPLLKLLQENGQSIPVVCILNKDLIIARIGAAYDDGHIVEIRDKTLTRVAGAKYFGYCPNKRFFALSKAAGVTVTEGWQGREVLFCPWPKGTENPPPGFPLKPFDQAPLPTRLIPFPDGQRVLLVSANGIFVLSADAAVRLEPTTEALESGGRSLQENYPNESLHINLSMEHGAISRNGKWIAIGHQDSKHLVFDSRLKLQAEIGAHSEYPHYALFSHDGSMAAFNACHFYSGVTIGALLKNIRGMRTESYEHDPRLRILDDSARVYAGVSREKEFIVGDASGYLRAFDQQGKHTWVLFIGSTICDIDLSPDERYLVVSTYAGFVCIVELDTPSAPAYQIGTAAHTEFRRWLFWRTEERPLIW